MAKSWSEVQSVIIAKAMMDEEYRRRLWRTLRESRVKEIGEPLPEGAKIKVIEAEPENGVPGLAAIGGASTLHWRIRETTRRLAFSSLSEGGFAACRVMPRGHSY